MRHFLPNQNIKNLAILQKHIGSILKEISEFEGEDRSKSAGNVAVNPCASSSKKIGKFEKPKRFNKSKLGKEEKLIYKIPNGNLQKKKVIADGNISVKQRVYLCRLCSVGNRTKGSHLKHLNSHKGDPVSCIKCRKCFKNEDSFKWHLSQLCIEKDRKKKAYKCDECSKELKTKQCLKKHLEGHKKNKCLYCDKPLASRKHLIHHLTNSHSVKLNSKLFSCNKCNRRFVKRQSLYYHFQKHLVNKFVCLQCGSISDGKEQFEEHIANHNVVKKFTCSLCNAKFLRKQHYMWHIKCHTLYKCITCNESVGSKEKAVYHKQRGHKVEGLHPRYLCPHCPSLYHQKIRLHHHLKKHTEITGDITCKYCATAFSLLSAYYKHCLLVDHRKYHTESKCYTCELCMKSFSKKYLLSKHYYMQHKVFKESFKCKHCDYKTFYKNNFERHEKLHGLVEKSFMCDQCGKTFSSDACLKDHISYNHTQDKKFVCTICGKSFKRTSELTRHQATHSDIRPYTCSICGTAFKRKTHLQRHEKNVHQKGHQSQKTHKVNVEAKETSCVIPQKMQHQPNKTSDYTIHLLNTSEVEKETPLVIPEEMQHETNQSSDYTIHLLKNASTSEVQSLDILPNMLNSKSTELIFMSNESLTEHQIFFENVTDGSYEILVDLSTPNQIAHNIMDDVTEFG